MSGPDTVYLTVGRATADGWACVDDGGRPRRLARDALVGLRGVRPGQRLRATLSDGVIVRAELP